AARGPAKRQLAGTRLKRLKTQFAPAGLLHYGQGKWYPGESLPRWALSCFWRRDGVPIWSRDCLVADEAIDYGHGSDTARRFIERLAAELGIDGGFVIPAYEDAWYYLWKERRLPVNVDPLQSRLENQEERARIATIFERGLNEIVGFVLPVRREGSSANAFWTSGRWFFRSEHMFLIPGDSPIGFRLPLDSLPWVAPDEYPFIHQPDPSVVLPPL